ncbi:MAG: ATP-dependent DNA helicase, partial [Thermodesulfobacteriota bacterium]
VKPIDKIIINSLSDALSDAQKDDKTNPITAWKSTYTKKNSSGLTVIKDTEYLDKLFTLADLYERYQGVLYQRRYYDFDDMILNAIKGIKTNKTLRYELQNKYEYILVDEFQDTNGAQMTLLDLITSRENEQPNIMAVGDDDQAVYKFQGAELSNIVDFNKRYKNTNIITVTGNYRSTKDILEVARHVITQADSRLENKISGLNKKITSELEGKINGEISNQSFLTELHQYNWVASKIKELIENGKSLSEIAVISRNHKYLEKIAMVLNNLDIPISYEKNNNVLTEPHIYQLIQISRFICSLCRKNMDEADEFLPEILCYPFWKIDRKKIWEIAGIAERSRKMRLRWLEVMKDYDDENINQITGFFLDIAALSTYETLEHILDKIMGAHEELTPDSEDEEENIPQRKKTGEFTSPFKQYYFGKNRLKNNSVEYIRFLSGLRTFIQALRDYKKDKILKIEDIVEFVELHQKNNIPVVDKSPFVNAFDAVNLLTAHKAKGLEFETVFVINCVEDVWKGKNKASYLPPPLNLPITPAGDNEDDQLRLFYVAITRAKYDLFFSSYEYKDDGRRSSLLSFILNPENDCEENTVLNKLLTIQKNRFGDPEITAEILRNSWESKHKPPVVHDEKAVIDKLLENYRLSVTHLNNFLDVSNGGPLNYFEQNLLRFPQSKTLSGSFGSAIHRTIELTYRYLKQNDKLPEKDEVLNWFDDELKVERLNEKDYKDSSNKGRRSLNIFYDKKIVQFDKSHYSEFNFYEQGVVIGDAYLTGKIDKIVKINENELSVHDFKTGKAKKDWDIGNDYEKVILHKYKQQLVFYKILVENSKYFGGKYKVNTGVLEFIEPENDDIFELSAVISEEEVKRTINLIQIVYGKIMSLDFPDTSSYKQSINGIIDFENDLLDEKI